MASTEVGTGVVDQTQTSGAASGAAVVSTGSATSTGSAGATGPGSSPLPKWEDDPRAKGILADLQKERKARQDFERRVAAAEAIAEERQRQFAALTNTRTPTTEEAEAAEIRQRFGSVVTREFLLEHLGLSADDIEAIRESKASRGDLEAAIKHHWTEHSRGMLNQVYTKIGAEIGDLTPSQQRKIMAIYIADAEANPDFMKRHDAGDKTLIDEFVKSYLDDTVEPVRRKVTASEVQRNRAVPNSNNRTLPQHGGKPIDVNDNKAVMDLIMESRRGKFSK